MLESPRELGDDTDSREPTVTCLNQPQAPEGQEPLFLTSSQMLLMPTEF